MKQVTVFLLVFMLPGILKPQNEVTGAEQEILQFQHDLNAKFTSPDTTILLPEDFRIFKGLEFYPINLNFRVEAEIIRTPEELPFQMHTTTNRLPWYVKYGELHFTIYEMDFKLDIFKNLEPKPGYEDYLFLPFTDFTSGNGSYGGGRYIDLILPEKTIIILDFNQSYNPYCVYNPKYSCPIPPEQNDLKISIEAGVMDFKK